MLRLAFAGVGLKCGHCGELVRDGEEISCIAAPPGESLHRDCGLRMVVGSLGHQLGVCHCPGHPGIMDDPPGLTARESARAAAEFFRQHQSGEHR